MNKAKRCTHFVKSFQIDFKGVLSRVMSPWRRLTRTNDELEKFRLWKCINRDVAPLKNRMRFVYQAIVQFIQASEIEAISTSVVHTSQSLCYLHYLVWPNQMQREDDVVLSSFLAYSSVSNIALLFQLSRLSWSVEVESNKLIHYTTVLLFRDKLALLSPGLSI